MVIKNKVTENFTGNGEKDLSTTSKENPNYSKRIGIAKRVGTALLPENDGGESEEKYSIDDLIYRFANGNYGYQKLLAAWFGDYLEKYESGITMTSFVTIKFFVKELYKIRDGVIKSKGDTRDINTIILKVVQDESLGLGERLTECHGIDWMIDEFVRDVSHKETVKRWFDTKKSRDGISYRKGITIKYFMDELFKIKSHIENNKKESRWVDVILCDIWKYALYGHI